MNIKSDRCFQTFLQKKENPPLFLPPHNVQSKNLDRVLHETLNMKSSFTGWS